MSYFEFMSVNDFIAGWVSGIASAAVSYPLETIKVRRQTMSSISSIAHATFVYKHEGLRGLFRGMSYPLYTSGVLSSVYFGIYGNSLRMIETYRGQQHHKTCCEEIPAYKGWHFDCFIAGCIGGVFTTIINTPIELVKTILQSGTGLKTHAKSKQLTPTECTLNIIKRRGLKGCFHGAIILLIRDVPTYGLYAVCYEHILCWMKRGQHTSIFMRISQEGIAGGCSGVITWAIVNPVDVIKSRYMSDGYNDLHQRRYTCLTDCISKTYRKNGIPIFFKGFWISVTRAFPVNVVCFITYEQVLKICKYFS